MLKIKDIVEIVVDATVEGNPGFMVEGGTIPLKINEVESESWASKRLDEKNIIGYNLVGVGDKDEIYILDGAFGYKQTLSTLGQIFEGMRKKGKNVSLYFIPSVGGAVGWRQDKAQAY